MREQVRLCFRNPAAFGNRRVLFMAQTLLSRFVQQTQCKMNHIRAHYEIKLSMRKAGRVKLDVLQSNINYSCFGMQLILY